MMRDTSRDQRTGWLRNGDWYAKQGHSLGDTDIWSRQGFDPDRATRRVIESVGTESVRIKCGIPPGKLESIPEGDRTLVLEEAESNPKFCAYLVQAMETNPGWAHEVSQSAKEAVVNEFDPSKYPGRREGWVKLRARARDLLASAMEEANRSFSRLTPQEKQAFVKRIKMERGSGMAGLGELGQWDIITSIIGSVSKVAGDIYGNRIIADANRDIAKIQAQAAAQAAAAQAAVLAPQQPMATASMLPASLTRTIAGVPAWVIAVPVVGGILYFALRKKRRR